MRIYKMTATFGKLEQQTLTLEPGLNIITAPNEWGKSTWCGFLAAMLYGLDTRAKSTKTTLADKERFAPWSGSPMAGRIDLNWKGRDITIQRQTKGRVPLGEFKAYETASGLPVPELTAANCGSLLLGVEQSVFRRAGFIRLSDLPVTQDEALRRRLNALVTTGDESGAADRLADNLRDLKNRCRYKRTGLLPQLEQQREALEGKLEELGSLDQQMKKLNMRLGELKSWLSQLRNHQLALDRSAAEADAARVAEAREELERAEDRLAVLEAACASLPSLEETEQKIRELKGLRDEWNALQMELQMLPRPPLPPAKREPFGDLSLEQGAEMVRSDQETYSKLRRSKDDVLSLFLGAVALIGAVVLLVIRQYPAAGITAGAGLLALILALGKKRAKDLELKKLESKYGSPDAAHWADGLRSYSEELRLYNQAVKEYRESQGDVEVRQMVLRKRRESTCGDQEPEALLEFWQQTAAKRISLQDARREAQRCGKTLQTLTAMAKPLGQAAGVDELTFTQEETTRLTAECMAEQQRLQTRKGQYEGRMEALGDRKRLQGELLEVNRRIQDLEKTYAALTLAQEALVKAREELQRRFAPRISQRGGQFLEAMTGGRYRQLTIGADFSLLTGADTEQTIRDALWRSDGTVDQLYLALRLAVAEELTPDAPLILDDALARFDDDRMAAAVGLLKDMSKSKQVILFTCQGRESSVCH